MAPRDAAPAQGRFVPATALFGVVVTFAAVQGADGLFITPRVLGGRVGLSPVAVIFALSLGGELLGYAGVILAVPCAAVVKVLLAHARRHFLDSAFYRGAQEDDRARYGAVGAGHRKDNHDAKGDS